MILRKSNLMTFDYNPATDILFVEWPDIHDFFIQEIEEEIRVLVDTIKHYDVKKLLIDTSKAVIEVNDTQYKAILASFAHSLAVNTRLKKLARVSSNNSSREKLVDESKDASLVAEKIAFQNFTNKNAALEWLIAA